MERVLVVDDSPDQARMCTAMLHADGFATEVVTGGGEALVKIDEDRPDVVLTDLRMPGMDGLELVEEIVRLHASLPVVLMTAYGNGEIAMRALQKGAASYVPKRLLADQLTSTIRQVLQVTSATREHERLLVSLVESDYRFVLGTDPSLITPLVSHVERIIASRLGKLPDNEQMRLSLALQEALLNGMHHGNLEVDSEIRESSVQEYHRLIEQRQRQSPFCDRCICLTVALRGTEVVLSVEDEGPGFDVSAVPDPTDPSNLLRCSGRGLYLIGTFMDRVTHAPKGNKITMTKLVCPDPPGSGAGAASPEAVGDS